MKKRENLFRALVMLLILALSLVFVYSVVRVADKFFAPVNSGGGSTTVSKTIVKDGVEYFPRQDITVLMLMGIDRSGAVEGSDSYNNDGAADMVALAIFDEAAKAVNVLMLNRDTVVEMPVLGLNGQQAGTAYAQLALAHTQGSGLRDSCENVLSTVSTLLHGVEIDHYLSMNMDTVALLTDAVGGVKVTVTEDFSAVDPTIPMGEVTLNGKQAFNFVQNRKGVGSQMNVSRMERQKSYINGFMEALDGKLKSGSFVADTYAEMESYIVSNTSATGLNSLLSRYADYTLNEIVTPEGENKNVDGYMEFHVDEEKLTDLTLRLFYSEKNI